MNDDNVGKRFDRLEVKIDRLTEVMANVARVEERIIGQDARLKRHEFRLDENEKKLEDVSAAVATNTQLVRVGQSLIASIWAVVLGTLMYLFRE